MDKLEKNIAWIQELIDYNKNLIEKYFKDDVHLESRKVTEKMIRKYERTKGFLLELKEIKDNENDGK